MRLIFSSKTQFDSISKLPEVCEKRVTIIFSHDLLVSQKFLRAQSKDRHDIRTVDDKIVVCKLSQFGRI